MNVIGVLGILLIAKQRKLITKIQQLMDDLIAKAGFRINQGLYLDVLKLAQETNKG
ncbi:DUF3368 domain-containing protein [Dapis sp. BLCC M229]|uniref:DUF3368 domain-containing protein n=1 Tax=Dapis sp. BLCC M229 TaxID=3400188 RepID=UPI003CE997D5